ncbi:MAG TPA: 3-hydroxyacyl-CoA dehydrogenase NAD-binding domain-containing protein [Thermoplasmata archaeon]|nr:3-hydroxyacyl-CoA dehydrogenase NAD-binding domain-containing protein [Thermoplasmata archaeon]
MRVTKVAVVGAGTMGAAIAELLAYNDLPVLLTDVDESRVRAGVERVGSIVDDLVRFQAGRAREEIARMEAIGLKLSEGQRETVERRFAPKVTRARGDEIVRRVQGTMRWSDFHDVDLAIEAVFEREAVKRPVLTALDAALPDHAVIASNTSSLSITRLAAGLRHAPATLALHFFNPPSTLPLVEVAGGVETREDILVEAIDFLQGLRNHRAPLVPIRVKESPGFVVNRILLPVLNEACFALQESLAPARDIDLAMKAGAGLPMGPFELADLIGLDVALEVSETLLRDTGDPKYRPAVVLRRLVDAGHLGRKTGRGFYEYPTAAPGAAPGTDATG